MKVIAVGAREWRDRWQELLDTALEQDVLLAYLRRQQPAFFVIPKPMRALPEQRANYYRLLRMYWRVTQSTKPMPADDAPIPSIPANALRRDVNETLTTLKQQGVPQLLRRYDDVVGFVVPVPTGSGGMAFIRQLAAWFASEDPV